MALVKNMIRRTSDRPSSTAPCVGRPNSACVGIANGASGGKRSKSVLWWRAVTADCAAKPGILITAEPLRAARAKRERAPI